MKKPRYPNNLKKIREMRGFSQEALASSVGTIRGQIYKLETGERKLTHPWMVRLAKPLECNPEDFVSEDFSLMNGDVSERPSLTETELGLLKAIQAIIAILSDYNVIQEKDLGNLFSYQLRDFRMKSQPGASEVMSRLIDFLNGSSPEEIIQKARKPVPQPQDQSKIGKSLES